MPHQKVVDVFHDLFPVEFIDLDGVFVGTIEELGVQVRVDPESASITLSSLVRDAHDGLPRSYLADLLKLNVPNDLTGAFFLAERRGSGHLELTGTIPIASLAVSELERLVLDHWAAALTIGDGLDARFQAEMEEH